MATTVRVGVLNDMGDLGAASDDIANWLEREVETLRARGRIAQSVEFCHAYGLGLPTGTAEAIEHAYQELVDQDVALIVGPGIDDNALVIAPLAERLRVPTIHWTGAERARGKYMFQVQASSHEEEGLLIARHLSRLGARRLGVAYDISPTGTRYLRALENEAAALGLDLCACEGISPVSHDADEIGAALLASEPDAVVYLGIGVAAPALARSLAGRGWQGPRMMNTAGLRGYRDDFAKECDGWRYVGTHSDGNRTLQALCDQLDVPASGRAAAAKGHDLGRLVAEGIARARDVSREGLRLGLEQVKWLPAAQGEEGTLLSFGVHDHAGLHGRYLVVRQWHDGQSVEVS